MVYFYSVVYLCLFLFDDTYCYLLNVWKKIKLMYFIGFNLYLCKCSWDPWEISAYYTEWATQVKEEINNNNNNNNITITPT